MKKLSLDKKDRAILEALEQDARARLKDISKKTGIPRDSVNYRIKRLLSEKIIKGFAPICDPDKMGYPIYAWMCFQVQGFDEETDKKFTNFLKSIPNIPYIARCTGHYHFGITVCAKNIEHLDKTIMKIITEFPEIIKSYNVSLILEEEQYDTFHRLIE